MINISPPSLLSVSSGQHQPVPPAESPITEHSLLDLMYDGFYALLLLKDHCTLDSATEFLNKLKIFLKDFESGARRLGASAADIDASKYAFCAAVDEIILHSSFSIRETWEQRPLQLSMFGDQLAGQNFFQRLEDLRSKGSCHQQALEVFHMCLLLGFNGKYLLEGSEKLSYLTARLGEEITQMKGKPIGFAPKAERPDHITHKLRSDVPIWVICSVFALITITGYLALDWMLSQSTETTVNAYSEIVKLGSRTASLIITLP
jgi:type VI secretion system protein ImpK